MARRAGTGAALIIDSARAVEIPYDCWRSSHTVRNEEPVAFDTAELSERQRPAAEAMTGTTELMTRSVGCAAGEERTMRKSLNKRHREAELTRIPEYRRLPRTSFAIAKREALSAVGVKSAGGRPQIVRMKATVTGCTDRPEYACTGHTQVLTNRLSIL